MKLASTEGLGVREMGSRNWIASGALVFLAGLSVVLQTFFERRNRRRSLSSRDTLPDHELSALFTPSPAIAPAVLFILNEVAERLRVERGKLRPDDTFATLRGVSPQFALWSDLEEVGDLIGEFIPPGKFEASCKLETLGEFVVFVANEAICGWEPAAPKK